MQTELPRLCSVRDGVILWSDVTHGHRGKDASTPLRYAQHDAGKQRTSTCHAERSEASHT